MNCSQCGYAMDAFDSDCPKCHGKGLPKAATSAAKQIPTQPQSSLADAMSSQVNLLSATSGGTKKPYQVGQVEVDEDSDLWWQVIGGGFLIFGLTAFSHWRMTNMETTGGLMRMRWYDALLYQFGGKWLVTGIGIAIGVLAIIAGITIYLLRDKK